MTVREKKNTPKKITKAHTVEGIMRLVSILLVALCTAVIAGNIITMITSRIDVSQSNYGVTLDSNLSLTDSQKSTVESMALDISKKTQTKLDITSGNAQNTGNRIISIEPGGNEYEQIVNKLNTFYSEVSTEESKKYIDTDKLVSTITIVIISYIASFIVFMCINQNIVKTRIKEHKAQYKITLHKIGGH